MNKKLGIYDIVMVGVMAAMVFAATAALSIQIPTPTGPTMLKVGNIFCLLAGMTLGPVRGGLAAGIGSMFFDLLNPAYVAYAPFTLAFFFMMGFVCGLIAFSFDRKGKHFTFNLIGAISGALTYMLLHFSRVILELVLAGSTLEAALLANTPKYITSGTNAVIAVVASVLLAPAFRAVLVKSGVMSKLR